MSIDAPNIARLKQLRALCIAVVAIYFIGWAGIDIYYSGDNRSERETAQTPVCVRDPGRPYSIPCYPRWPGYFIQYGIFVVIPFGIGIGITDHRIRKQKGK